MRRVGLIVVLVMALGLLLSCASPPPPPPLAPWSPPNIEPTANESILIVRRDLRQRHANSRINVTAHGGIRILQDNSEEGRVIIPNGAHLITVRQGSWVQNLRIYANSEQIIVYVRGANSSLSLSLSSRENLNGATVSTTGIAGALERAAEDVARNFTAQARIAIVYVSTEDRTTTEFITGELEHILWRRGFVIVDRSELDRIRTEQNFGLAGEVDDNTATRIGQFAGASVVITGIVDGAGDLRRLRFRALDTATAQVVGVASERI